MKILILLVLLSCSRNTRDVKLTFGLKTLAEPSSSTDINCFGILLRYPETPTQNSCQIDSESHFFNVFAGLTSVESTLTLPVEVGSDRVFYLFGVHSDTGECLSLKDVKPGTSPLSQAYLLATHTESVNLDTQEIFIRGKFDSTKIIGQCEGGIDYSQQFQVGGVVTGSLTGSLELELNTGNVLSLTSTGGFLFPQELPNGSSYTVKIKSQPSGSFCLVSNGVGTISSAHVTNVSVSCLASGSLDATFAGGTGKINQDNSSSELGISLSISPDQSIILGGYFSGNMAVWKYNSSGIIDSSWGTNGVKVTGITGNGSSNDVAVSPSNDVIAFGSVGTSWRVEAFTSSSSSIGTDTFSTATNEGRKVYFDTSGNLYAVGIIGGGCGFRPRVIKYSSLLTRDSSYGSAGISTPDGCTGQRPTDFYVDSSGRALIPTDNGNVVRFNSSGTALDSTWNSSGTVSTGAAGESEAIAEDSTGRIYIAGGGVDIKVRRYLNNGTLDTSFGSSGVATINTISGTGTDEIVRDMEIDGNGRLVLVGRVNKGGTDLLDMSIWRLTSNGALDTSFNGVGYLRRDNEAGSFVGDDEAFELAIDSLGRYLVVGYSDNNSTDEANAIVWRILP